MMLIATSLTAIALLASAAPASTAAAGAAPVLAMPPITVQVSVAPDVPPSLVSRLLGEASEIWGAGGFSFVWHIAAQKVVPNTLRVVIGDKQGNSRDSNRTPLGWIVFDDDHSPVPEIYLSRKNATALMYAARPVIGVVDHMPIVQRELLLARALGRALAHEMGHYLLATKVHTPKGLLQAVRTASELFSASRAGFRIDPAQRQQVASRIRREQLVAS
jgi:hypothetical protein